MTKASTCTHKKKYKKKRDNTKTPPKSSITRRLLTDLGRSVGVMKATQLVWLNRLRDPNMPTNRKSKYPIIQAVIAE